MIGKISISIALAAVAVSAAVAAVAVAGPGPHQPTATAPVQHGPVCQVPRLIGMTLPRVRDRLNGPGHGCRVVPHGDLKGRVVRQKPHAGRVLPWKSRVEVWLRSPR